MPSRLLIPTVGYALLSLAASLVLTAKLSRRDRAIFGILPALACSLISYAATIVSAILFDVKAALLVLLLTELAPLASFFLFARIRTKRYRALFAAYKAQKKETRPAIVTTIKMRRALKGFSIKSHLTEEAQHEIVILLKNGTDPKTILQFYNCRESDLRQLERAFDNHMAENAPTVGGEAYTVTSDQREFLLRLMLTSTPSGLSCGEGLLWCEKSIAALIRKASGITPSHNSVLRFLDDCGFLLGDGHFAFSETPEAKLWEKGQYEKIRMAALERSATIVWLYALSAKGLPYTALIATSPESRTLYGIYKENSGLGDFLNKLGSGRIYAVTTFKTADFKKFTAPPSNITLFPYGERRDIPDT